MTRTSLLKGRTDGVSDERDDYQSSLVINTISYLKMTTIYWTAFIKFSQKNLTTP